MLLQIKINIKTYCCILFFTIAPLFLFAQKEAKNKLQVKGQIVNSLGRVSNVFIRLVEKNKTADTILVKSGRYDIYIPLETEILIEFIAENHYTKRIAFDTHVNGKKKLPFFDLKINLNEISLWNLSEENIDLMDFPVAYIRYNFKKKLFYDSNEKYSRIISKELSNVKRN